MVEHKTYFALTNDSPCFAWVSNYIHVFVDVITIQCPDFS